MHLSKYLVLINLNDFPKIIHSFLVQANPQKKRISIEKQTKSKKRIKYKILKVYNETDLFQMVMNDYDYYLINMYISCLNSILTFLLKPTIYFSKTSKRNQ